MRANRKKPSQVIMTFTDKREKNEVTLKIHIPFLVALTDVECYVACQRELYQIFSRQFMMNRRISDSSTSFPHHH